jgi:signal transduction histidine kinase
MSLSTHLALQRSYIVITLLPGIIVSWLVPHPTANILGILFLLAIGFLFAIGRKLNRSYWTSLKNNRLLSRRAEQLAEAKIKAEIADRAKSQFVANISHELRTPLNGLIGTIELLRHDTSAESQTEYLDVMAGSAQVLLHRISEILDFSKIDAGKLELDTIAMDPVSVAQEATSLMRDAAESKGLTLEVDIAGDLPQTVIGDPYRLNQILLNLLSNAIKFTEQGRITVTLEQLQSPPDVVILRFTVSDTGIGIPQKARERIFESFVQAEGSSARRYGGTGLGLSVASELVRLMGGELRVHSQVGVGSHFSFSLTFETPREVTTSGLEVNDTEENEAPPPLKLNVLLAEDNQVNQFVAEEMLGVLQCKTHCAHNGQAAVDQFEKGGIDVILMDCEMPEMDGFEATKRIRQIESVGQLEPVPIIALTAHLAREDRERTASVGMNGFLSKPFTVNGLYKALLEVTEESNRPS